MLHLLLDNGYFPVVTIPIISDQGEALNTDADRAAAALAGALKADTLVLLSNVPGLLKDPADPSTRIAIIPKGELEGFAQYAQDRMKKKVLGAREALEAGVSRVAFGSANRANPVSGALSGEGTLIS